MIGQPRVGTMVRSALNYRGSDSGAAVGGNRLLLGDGVSFLLLGDGASNLLLAA